jgi:hypothetical protein
MTHLIPVSTGLLEPKHVKAIGGACWVYLWFINRVTKDVQVESADFDGIVLGGQPVAIARISEELGIPYDTCRKHVARLVRSKYITQDKISGLACSYVVKSSKKWLWQRCGNESTATHGRASGHKRSDPTPVVVAPATTDGLGNKETVQVAQNENREEQPSPPGGEVDPRHASLRTEIQKRWLRANPGKPAAPWNGRTASTLKRLLIDNPAWKTEQLEQCINNRFASEMNHAEDPVFWIPRLLSYASGPLDQFNKPKGIRNGNNKAEKLQQSNLAAGDKAITLLQRRMAY